MKSVTSMEYLQDLAAKFWVKTGRAPTHILMTTEQQDEMSQFWQPKEHIVSPNPIKPDSKIAVLHLVPGCTVDILPVPMLRAGDSNYIELPVMIRIEP